MKDAKGHGSNARGEAAAHQAGTNDATAAKRLTIFRQDGEFAVPIANGKGHSFHSDKEDAEATARAMHGHNVEIKYRSKRWGPEMD